VNNVLDCLYFVVIFKFQNCYLVQKIREALPKLLSKKSYSRIIRFVLFFSTTCILVFVFQIWFGKYFAVSVSLLNNFVILIPHSDDRDRLRAMEARKINLEQKASFFLNSTSLEDDQLFNQSFSLDKYNVSCNHFKIQISNTGNMLEDFADKREVEQVRKEQCLLLPFCLLMFPSMWACHFLVACLLITTVNDLTFELNVFNRFVHVLQGFFVYPFFDTFHGVI